MEKKYRKSTETNHRHRAAISNSCNKSSLLMERVGGSRTWRRSWLGGLSGGFWHYFCRRLYENDGWGFTHKLYSEFVLASLISKLSLEFKIQRREGGEAEEQERETQEQGRERRERERSIINFFDCEISNS